jgi:N-acetyl-anhydromuramyl-L-alanine amidase AmpD
MQPQYPHALWIPHNKYGYPQGTRGRNGQALKYIVIHGTGMPGTAQEIARYFQTSPIDAGTHFVIGRDGVVVQCCHIEDAAWGNGGPQPGADPFWPTSINANLLTVSIEHCKPSLDNSDSLTDPQSHTSFRLIKWLCENYSIPKHPADASGGIATHASIAPIDRFYCPGPYPWDELYIYLNTPSSLPPTEA